MSLDEVKKRFVEEIKLRAYDDKYIDKDEEREILQQAIQMGVSVDSARAALAQVCEANSYIQESKVLSQIKDLIDTFAGNDGHIDHKEFEDSVTTCKKACQGKRTDVQCKKMVIQVIEDNSYKVKSGGWFAADWYQKEKKSVGL
jgi:DNA-directed RNA polymerase beta subunit